MSSALWIINEAFYQTRGMFATNFKKHTKQCVGSFLLVSIVAIGKYIQLVGIFL